MMLYDPTFVSERGPLHDNALSLCIAFQTDSSYREIKYGTDVQK